MKHNQWSDFAKIVIVGLCLLCCTAPSLSFSRQKRASKQPVVATDDSLAKILFYENRRIAKSDFLLRSLSSSSMEIRKAALIALGRIGDPSALDEIAKLLMNRKNDLLREYSALSLGLMGGDLPLKILSQNLSMQHQVNTQAQLIRAIGIIGNEQSVKPVAKMLRPDTSPYLTKSICEALGLLWNKDSMEWEVPGNLL
ncbi:MAG: HEAT repeat domain-containing protein, partial [Pseudomonadota bacterium]